MVEDALSFWTEIQRYEDMLTADAKSQCFAPLSELYRKLGLLDDAISVAQKGCALHPDLLVGFLALGNACYAKGLSAEARRALERVVALKPDHLQALKLLGQIYVEQGEIVLAKKVLGQVLQQEPDDMESTMLLNSVASVTPRTQVAEELLEEADIIEDLEELLEEPDGFDTAAPLDLVELASEPEPPKESAAQLEDADDYWAIEDLEELVQPQQAASPALTAAAPKAGVASSQQHAAPDPLTTATLAELYATQGFVDKALKIYREMLQAHPSNQQYQLRCAELLEMKELQHHMQQSAEPIAAAEAPAMEESFDMEEHFDMEEPLPMEEAFDMEAPLPVEASAVTKTPAAPVAGSAPEGNVETELQRWLENIRRRKDGV